MAPYEPLQSTSEVSPGDRVICLKPCIEDGLVEGKVYTVSGVVGRHPYLLELEETGMQSWSPRRFAKAAPPALSMNPKDLIGIKKPSVHFVPPVALFEMGRAMTDGGAKYGAMNWREHKVTGSVYYDAAMRHIMAWWDGEETAADSGVHHLGHAMACFAIMLDAQHGGTLNDDRSPHKGPLPAFLKDHTV